MNSNSNYNIGSANVLSKLDAELQKALGDYEWTGNVKYDQSSAPEHVASAILENEKIFSTFADADSFEGVNLERFIKLAVAENMGSMLYRQFKELQNPDGAAPYSVKWADNRLDLLGIKPENIADSIDPIKRAVLDTYVRSFLAGYKWAGDPEEDRSGAAKHLAAKLFNTERIYGLCKDADDFKVINPDALIDSAVFRYMGSSLYGQFKEQKKLKAEAQDAKEDDVSKRDEAAIVGLDALYRSKPPIDTIK